MPGLFYPHIAAGSSPTSVFRGRYYRQHVLFVLVGGPVNFIPEPSNL